MSILFSEKKIVIGCDIPIVSLIDFDNYLPPNETFTVNITYPLSKKFSVKIKTGKRGLKIANLLLKIGEGYKHVYDNENKYGIWGHDIVDLHLEQVSIDLESKDITIFVGS